MDSRATVLAEIVRLARQHGLTSQDIAAALAGNVPSNAGRRDLLLRVLGFIGGTFVFAGVGVFIALQWDRMTSAAHVVITLGSGLAAFVLALLADRDARFEKAATPLFLMAAALQPTGLMVLFGEYGAGGDWRWAALVTVGTMTVQFAATFTSIRRSTLLFLCVTFSALSVWTAFDLLDLAGEVIALVLGASLLSAAAGIDRTLHRAMTPACYFVGSVAMLLGLFDLVEHTPLEPGFLLAAAACVYMSVALHTRTLLFVATLAILAYTAWFTNERFADSLGWPVALVAFGFFLIATGALALRVDRSYLRPPAQPR